MKRLLVLSVFVVLCSAATWQQIDGALQKQRSVPVCMPGYYWTTQSCQPCKRLAYGICTCKSQNECTSAQCNTGFVFQNGDCVSNVCPYNKYGCTKCGMGADAVLCFECSSDYTLIGNVCIKNLGCTNFDLSTAICQSCMDGYYLSYNYTVSGVMDVNTTIYYARNIRQCGACGVGNCAKCTSDSNCIACNSGYFWQVGSSNNLGSCASCPSNCASCTGSLPQNCTSCVNNYYQNSNTMVCETCGITNCAACASAKTCQTCVTPNTLSSDQTACNAPPLLCLTGCANCGPDNKCTSCIAGYAPNLIGGACVACPSGCSTCQQFGTASSTSCTACSDTYYLNVNNVTGNTCTLCSTANAAYYRCNGPNDATAAPGTVPVPTQCIDNYFLYNGTCISYQTINKCLTLTNSDSANCQTCLNGYTQYFAPGCQTCLSNCVTCGSSGGASPQVVCNTCQDGYYQSTTTTCSQCPNGCNLCTNSTFCSHCFDGYYGSNNLCSACATSKCKTCDSNVCTACINGYFMFSSGNAVICNPCPANCASCSPPGQACSACATGYYLNANSGCVSMASANCEVSDSINGCTKCKYGFYLKNKFCFQCVDVFAASVCRENAAGPSDGTTPATSTNTSGITSNAQIITVLLSFILMMLH